MSPAPTAAQLERADQLLARGAPDQALTIFDAVLQKEPASLAALLGRGRALNNLRQPEQAEDAFRRAAELAPERAEIQNFLGHVLRAQGRNDDAIIAFQAALEIDGNLAVAHFNLGTVQALAGDRTAAIAAFETSAALGFQRKAALLNLGELHQFEEQYSPALECLSKATDLFPDDADCWQALAALLHSFGEVEKARDAYDRTLQLDPTSTAALGGRALLDELWGDIDHGLQMLHGRGDDDLLVYARARLLRRKGDVSESCGLLRSLVKSTGELSREPRLYFTLGEVLDESGSYDEAFAAYKAANALKPAPFDQNLHQQQIQQSIRFFDANRLRQLPVAAAGATTPVFIVGMPRSGTSLVEQILATHEQVHAGGERFELPEIITLLESNADYPGILTQLTADDLARLTTVYTNGYGPLASGKTVWTDKLPKNFLHLGLIRVLFPNARVIWCQRDPRDIGLSVFFQDMNFRSDPWTSRLGHIAAYIRSGNQLMQHWRSCDVLPILPLRYETLVQQPEQQIRRLLQFVQLPWDEACLEFHRTRRLVNTASYAQVRKPLYRSSMERWRNYQNHLGPLAQLVDQINA